MKTKLLTSILFTVVLHLVSPVAGQDLPKLPAEIRLTDGRVIRNGVVAKMTTETVLIRHSGTSVLVRYEFLPAGVRPVLERVRPGGSKMPAGETSESRHIIEGQVFIQTRGSGPYKFGNTAIYAFPETATMAWQHPVNGIVRLPAPIAKTVTDADGKFRLAVPSGVAFVVFAQASRVVGDAAARYEWRVHSSDVKEGEPLNLASDHRHEPQAVEIEPTH